MGQIKVEKCPIEGLYVIEPTVHGDDRGYFMETYNQNDMHEAGLDMVFVQDNQSMSKKVCSGACIIRKSTRRENWCASSRALSFDVAVGPTCTQQNPTDSGSAWS